MDSRVCFKVDSRCCCQKSKVIILFFRWGKSSNGECEGRRMMGSVREGERGERVCDVVLVNESRWGGRCEADHTQLLNQ